MTNSAVPDSVRRTSDLIVSSTYCVAFTGAGISTPSGIPDFRSAGSGLWTQSDPMQVASLTAFRYHPEKFFEWLRPLASQIWAAQPNPAHLALARLEQAGYLRAVITQNIDGLHQRSGSTEVVEVHGSVSTLICPHCHSVFPAEDYANPFVTAGILPRCTNCLALLKPAITLFEEMLPMDAWGQAVDHSQQADCYLVIGSSLEVSPANDLPRLALDSGAKLIIITLSPTALDRRADVIIRADAAVVLPDIVDLVFNQANNKSS